MNNPPRNSKWFDLPPESIDKLETWLFDEQLTYKVALQKAQIELGYTGSLTSLQRFYHCLARERALQDLNLAAENLGEIASAPGTEAEWRRSGMKLLAQQFLSELIGNHSADVGTIGRLLLQSESNENERQKNELLRESLELRRERLNFQEKVWQFDLIESAIQNLPELNRLATDRRFQNDPYGANKRINAISKRLFGEAALYEFPENDEENAFRKEHYKKYGSRWHEFYLEAKAREIPGEDIAVEKPSFETSAPAKPAPGMESNGENPENTASPPIDNGP